MIKNVGVCFAIFVHLYGSALGFVRVTLKNEMSVNLIGTKCLSGQNKENKTKANWQGVVIPFNSTTNIFDVTLPTNDNNYTNYITNISLKIWSPLAPTVWKKKGTDQPKQQKKAIIHMSRF